SSHFTPAILATRGERLALVRWVWSGAADTFGPSEIEFLEVVEVDASGRQTLNVTFDPGALDAAYAELDARYATGEAAAHARPLEVIHRLREAIAARDWEGVAAALTPDCVLEDHRPLST